MEHTSTPDTIVSRTELQGRGGSRKTKETHRRCVSLEKEREG